MSGCSIRAQYQPYHKVSKKCFSHSRSDLAEPEVRDLDVPLLVEHHVVQLEVPVEHPVLVQIQQRDADLRSIKPERGKT